jgi:serpin B
MSMVIILPNKKTGLKELEEKLATKELSELMQRAKNTEVEVYLPKFKVESSLDLKPHLENVNQRKMNLRTKYL